MTGAIARPPDWMTLIDSNLICFVARNGIYGMLLKCTSVFCIFYYQLEFQYLWPGANDIIKTIRDSHFSSMHLGFYGTVVGLGVHQAPVG